jgi:predicted P-loop ATPase/GTPase
VCNWQHDYYKYHHELTPLLHIEETPGLHQELTGVHTEETVLHAEITGAHFEFHDGVHFEQEYGAHMKIGNMTEFNSNFQKIQFTSDQTEVIEEVTKIIDRHVEVVQKKLSVVANSLSNYVTKTELTQATHTIQAGVLSLTASKVLFLTGAQGIVMMSMDSIQIM